jgi:hypothetical protein
MSRHRIAGAIVACVALGAGSAPAMAQGEDDITSAKAQTVYCLDCHQCDAPSLDSPCLKPCPYTNPEGEAEGLSPKPSPSVVSLGLLSDLYEPVVFNHERHAKMSAMGRGCIVCHHYSPRGQTPPCKACHGDGANPKNLRQPGLRGAYHRQCLGCHREWNHETACVECHAERRPGVSAMALRNDADIVGLKHPKVFAQPTYLYVGAVQTMATFHHADHVDLFGLKCSDCHVKESCSDCHDVYKHPARTRSDPHQDCMRCHQEDIDNDCTLCHGETQREHFNHARRTGFDLTAYHESVQCGKCHNDGRTFSGLEARCSACHQLDWQPNSFDHTRTGTALDELHREIECAECHVKGVGESATCAGCHDKNPGPFKTVSQNGTNSADGLANQQPVRNE